MKPLLLLPLFIACSEHVTQPLSEQEKFSLISPSRLSPDSMYLRIFHEVAKCMSKPNALPPSWWHANEIPKQVLDVHGFVIIEGVYLGPPVDAAILETVFELNPALIAHESVHAVHHVANDPHTNWPEECAPLMPLGAYRTQ